MTSVQVLRNKFARRRTEWTRFRGEQHGGCQGAGLVDIRCEGSDRTTVDDATYLRHKTLIVRDRSENSQCPAASSIRLDGSFLFDAPTRLQNEKRVEG